MRNNGTIHNDGDLLNIAEEFFFFGIIINDGALVNRGTFFNAGAPDRGAATITNGELGTIDNGDGGIIDNHGEVGGGIVENRGVLRNAAGGYIGSWGPGIGHITSSGVISNAGTISVASMVNIGTLQNQTSGTVSTFGTPLGGGWLQNDGTVVNDGRFEVSGNMCCPGWLSNNGDFRNNGGVDGSGNSRLHNEGTFVNECLAPLQIYVLTGIPVVQLPCPGQSYFPLVAR